MDLVEQTVAACTLDLVDNTIIRDGATPSLVSGAAALENPLRALATAREGHGSQVRHGQARRLDVHHVCPGHTM
jgi:hypothetical protein